MGIDDESGEEVEEEDIYDKEGVEELEEEDEISPEEEAFMHGYNEAIKKKKRKN